MNIYAMKKPKKINSVSVSVALFVVVVGYLGYFYIPIYWPIFQLGGIMRGTCNDAYRITNDEQLMKKLVKEAQRTGLRLSKDNFRLTRIAWETEELVAAAKGNERLRLILEKRGKECVLEMHYESDYTWPIIEKPQHIVFESEARSPLEQVKWEKQCTCVTPGPSS